MPKQHLEKVERLRKVQEQLHRISEWKLAVLQRQITDLQGAQVVLIEALNNEDPLHGLFVEPTARRLNNLAREEDQLRQAETAQIKVTRDRAMQAKRMERFSDALSLESQRAAEKDSLLRLLDGLASRAQASRKL
ncbi:hypothetical protein [Microvirga terricola]|uniref:Flagellar export protein FliJ n=1 Tax=Microvirga terricola TaxID=2719797 RepID=A0ABX0VEY9_9HYPH|nr:hypothetical protein [Microvirga terricola]NIX78407.1 hypothetical protein [Microvirga terricola]